jgi:hypothetical protein
MKITLTNCIRLIIRFAISLRKSRRNYKSERRALAHTRSCIRCPGGASIPYWPVTPAANPASWSYKRSKTCFIRVYLYQWNFDFVQMYVYRDCLFWMPIENKLFEVMVTVPLWDAGKLRKSLTNQYITHIKYVFITYFPWYQCDIYLTLVW